MNADSAFHIGASHAVCQDYALAGNCLQPTPYVILSDGCSCSPDTDTGARLLVKAAEQTLLERGKSAACDPAALHREAARRALTWAEQIGLRPQAVDATLLTAHLAGDQLVIACTGDGMFCLQTRAGAIDVYSISYASGYPFYPSYAHQPERLFALENAGRSGKQVKHFRSASAEEPLRLRDTTSGGPPTEALTVRASEYKFAALFTDGIHSFCSARHTETGKRLEAVHAIEFVRDLVAFKSVRGAFVRRRLKRFLKDCRAQGWQHADDLAVGALHLGD